MNEINEWLNKSMNEGWEGEKKETSNERRNERQRGGRVEKQDGEAW